MSENEKLREALAYEQGCRDTWDAVRGTNADMRPDASAAYITCVQAAKTTLEKATLARAALSTPCVEQDADKVTRIERILRKHIVCDATGLSPTVASVFLQGFREAAVEILSTPPSKVDADDVERYCLGLLVEEGGEADQLIGKALRFGIDTPGVKRLDGTIDMEATPRSMLAVELGDKMAAIRFAMAHGIVDADTVAKAADAKFAKLTDPEARDNLGRPLAPMPSVSAIQNRDAGLRAALEKIAALNDGYNTSNGERLYYTADRIARAALQMGGEKP